MITGDNGVGKSSIFDSLCFALYDITTKGRKGDTVIRKRIGKNCAVFLTFSIDNDLYEIRNYRKHTVHKNEKYLLLNGNNITEATRKLTNDKIVNLLMPPDVFLNSILFSQFISKRFSELTDSGQKEILDNMLGLSRYDDYFKLFGDAIRESRIEDQSIKMGVLPSLEKAYNEAVSNCVDEEKNLLDEKEKFESKKKDLFAEANRLKLRYYDVQELISDTSILEGKVKDLSSEIGVTNSKIQTASKELNDSIIELKSKYKLMYEKESAEKTSSINKLISELKESIAKLDSLIEALKSKANENSILLKNKYIEKKSEIDSLHQKETHDVDIKLQKLGILLEDYKNQSKKGKEESSKIRDDIRDIEKGLKSDNPTCYACGQELDKSDKKKIDEILKSRKDALKKLTDVINSINLSFKTEANNYKRLEHTLDTLSDSYRSKITSLDEWKEKNKKKVKDHFGSNYSKLSTEKESFVERLVLANKQLTEVDGQIKQKYMSDAKIHVKNAKEEHDNKVKDLRIKSSSLNGKLKVTEDELHTQEKHKNELTELNASLKSKKQEFIILNENYQRSKSNLLHRLKQIELTLESSSEELKKNKEKVKLFEENQEILSFWKNGFGSTGIKAILLDEAVPILNKKANELSQLTDSLRVNFDSQKGLKSGELRNKFSINAVQTTNLTDDVLDFSGGEGRLVNIIVLLSLRHLMETMHGVHINIILLDEILDSLDPSNIEIVVRMLQVMSKESCVVLISHTLRDQIECELMCM